MNECIGVTSGIPGPSDFFGDGAAGAIHVTAGSTLILTDSLYASTVQIDAGGVISAQGYPIFAMVSFTNYGFVHSNGAAASGASGGGPVDIDDSGWSPGGNGGTGAGVSPPPAGLLLGSGFGGAGGAGISPGGSAPTSTLLRAPRDAIQAMCAGSPAGSDTVSLGLGGAGGGGDGTNAGGGGGGGAGNVLIASPTIVNAGALWAQGGAGAAATAGNAGGGGGGGGAAVYLIGRSVTNMGSVVTSGGPGGAGHGSGVAGANGTGGKTASPIVILV